MQSRLCECVGGTDTPVMDRFHVCIWLYLSSTLFLFSIIHSFLYKVQSYTLLRYTTHSFIYSFSEALNIFPGGGDLSLSQAFSREAGTDPGRLCANTLCVNLHIVLANNLQYSVCLWTVRGNTVYSYI